MILEHAILEVIPGEEESFETAFRQASRIIAAADGYVSHELYRCAEQPSRYLLLVRWRTLDDHVLGFRGSSAYAEWRALLHHFYNPFPTVEHFAEVAGS